MVLDRYAVVESYVTVRVNDIYNLVKFIGKLRHSRAIVDSIVPGTTTVISRTRVHGGRDSTIPQLQSGYAVADVWELFRRRNIGSLFALLHRHGTDIDALYLFAFERRKYT